MANFLCANIFIAIIQILVFFIDLFTFPFYYLIQRPWRQKLLMNRKGAEQIHSSEDEVTYRSLAKKAAMCKEAEDKGVDTVEKLFNFLYSKYAPRPCIGTRQILGVDHEVSPETGKVFTKYDLGEYQFITYKQMYQRALNFGKGVAELGYGPKTKVIMYADTRGK